MTKQNEAATENKKATAAAAPAPKAPANFSIKRKVTLPLSKWSVDVPKYLQITSPIFEGKQVAEKKGAQAEMEAAHLFRAVDLVTGEECEVIAGTVLMGILEEEYPNGAYVDKQFMITQHKVEGKRYKTYSVAEIEVK